MCGGNPNCIYCFLFPVIDGSGHQARGDTWPDQKFYIRILSSNVKPPTFEQQNVTLYVYQGSSVPVPPEYFKVIGRYPPMHAVKSKGYMIKGRILSVFDLNLFLI